jgi:hypothetical protein
MHRNECHRRCVHQQIPAELQARRMDQEYEREYHEQACCPDLQGPRNQEHDRSERLQCPHQDDVRIVGGSEL